MTQTQPPSISVPFGGRDVSTAEKPHLVDGVFARVAERYDMMNDAMSLGLHRRWKDMACRGLLARTRANQPTVLDVGAGTGDLAMRLLKSHADARLVLLDPNPSMSAVAEARLIDAGMLGRFDICQAYAEQLPFAHGSMDAAIAGFSMRNTTDLDAALAEIFRVLRHDAPVRVLEFTQVPTPGWRQLYHLWRDGALPRIGAVIANNPEDYRYLAESIARFPDAPTLAARMRAVGFFAVRHKLLAGGIVALHEGWKP